MKVISSRQDVRGSLDKIAFELQSSSPKEMATLLKDQLEVWRRTVQEIGIERN
jgi:tripartite-type tricarboxylate transporter receptor subunit TctC